ncbi:hypothetical protein [Acidiluteibacter ferrifornacis]|uniref:Uncharacterized protein n=1 Tax=Acidiluteibacter ferrifornacis TaxID=2692424 RepID=A0A6N9NMF2_9FLAO|nr:hypothetical protein [Acidiluteibacter ferrifornacis]NBG66641.1 hypothetical protein [Acidiluteibacter ferrifornacis]
MDQKISRRAVWWAALTLLYVLSYWREVVFRSINAIMEGANTFYAKTTPLPYLMNYNPSELNLLKYGLTVGFTVLFMFITYFGIKKGFNSALGKTMVKFIYGFCTVLTILLMLLAFFLNQFPTFYPYLRILVGWIHSPLIFLFISITLYALNTLNKKFF